MEYSRRSFLGSVCTVGSSVCTVNVLRTIPDGTAASRVDRSWSLERIGHSLLSDPPGGYTEGAVRADGRYAVLGSKFGNGGSFLVDLSDPTAPREAHRLPVPERTISPDVKFDPRDGLYYRSLEGNGGGVDVVDYGFGDAAADGPAVLSTMDAGDTHNVFPHPDAPIVYAVDDHGDTPGLDVWDVSDPSDPGMVRQAGPDGVLHDVVIDPDRDLAHAAYIGGDFEGYAILDTVDPWSPVEVGRFDYGDYSDYDDVGFGDEAFQNCHYADYDPDRKLAVVGDEVAEGAPGGKHVFDVGWDRGSPGNPVPIGFTLSPNARVMDGDTDSNAWTGHNFDVVPRDDATLLVSGDYKEGAVLYDITDPTDPRGVDWYPTDDAADHADGPEEFEPPRAWSADYADGADLVVAADVFTGIYTFRIAESSGEGSRRPRRASCRDV